MDNSFWSEVITNRILLIAVVVFVLFNLDFFFTFFKEFSYSISRANTAISTEHNLSFARKRNRVALFSVIPSALILDKYGLYIISWLPDFEPIWTSILMIGVILSYYLLRRIMSIFLSPRYIHPSSNIAAIVHSPFSFFIALTSILICTALVDGLLNIDLIIIQRIFWIEIAFVYLFSFVRTIKILAHSCRGLRSFLYLCALEIIPSTILVLGAIL